MRRDQRHQLGPGHHQVHLVEELALASPLRFALESALAQAHLFHTATVSHRAMAPRLCRLSLGKTQQAPVVPVLCLEEINHEVDSIIQAHQSWLRIFCNLHQFDSRGIIITQSIEKKV